MGWIDRLLGRRPGGAQAPGAEGMPTATRHPREDEGGYAVVDVETTGLSPRQDRIVSIAVVQLDPDGRPGYEWSTLIDPQGPVGATHIHGIHQQDVIGAPTFARIVPDLLPLLRGRVLSGHNVSFDERFLKFEFGRAGWGWPSVPTLCTLQESTHFLPQLDRRRLADCCWAAGVDLVDAHSALGDARATAALLAHYLDGGSGIAPLTGHRTVLSTARSTEWPSRPGTGPIANADAPPRALSERARTVIATSDRSARRSLLETFTLTDALDDGAPEGSLAYLEMLAEVLEDGQISEAERSRLHDLVEVYQLDDAEVAAAHRGFVRALVREAVEDGVLARAERAELTHVAGLLDVPDSTLKDLLDGEAEARLVLLSADLPALPTGWSSGEPFRVGQRIAFTGCEGQGRGRLEALAQRVGMRVGNSVTARTVALITDETVHGTKAAAAASLGTRLVGPAECEVLLTHIQPHQTPAPRAPRPVTTRHGTRRPSVGAAPTEPSATSSTVPPSVVRAWALGQGFDVGVRGRLSADVWEAYAASH